MIQNTYLRKYITSQSSILSACFGSILSGKLVIMFLTQVVLVATGEKIDQLIAD